jgi:hypothetical protein
MNDSDQTPPPKNDPQDDLDKILRDFETRRQTQTHETPRAGSARARRQQRRERSEHTARPARRSLRQTLPTDRFEMPKFRFPFNRMTLYVIGSVIVVVGVVLFLGTLRNDPAQLLPNAIWIGTEWTYSPQTDEDVDALVTRLREHRIGSVYAWVSWLQRDLTWRGEANFDNVKAFVQQFKSAYPESRLYGWVSFPVEEGGYRMDNIEIQTEIAAFSQRVIDEFGFDGVFLNIEPVWDNDSNFLNLLRAVRSRLGTDVPISTAIPPDWSPLGAGIPVPPLIVPGTVWRDSFKQSVALLVDEMAIMAYNSGLSDPNDYAQWVAYQVSTYAKALADIGLATQLMIGIPTYDAEPPGHDPLVENVESAVRGIREGLRQAGDSARFVAGAAIYAGWTTDEAEWLAFLQHWVSGG